MYFGSRRDMAWFFSLWIFGTADKAALWLDEQLSTAAAKLSKIATQTLDVTSSETSGNVELAEKLLSHRISPLFASVEKLSQLGC